MAQDSKVLAAEQREKFMSDIAGQVIALMKEHKGNWTRPWVNIGSARGYPENVVTGKHYRGMNVLILGMAQAALGYKYPAWASELQWQRRGGTIKEGEQPTQVIFFKPLKAKDKVTGQSRMIPLLRVYDVFNYEQQSGCSLELDDWFGVVEVHELPEHERMAHVDKYISNTGIFVRHGGDRAYYAPGPDYVRMPELRQFKSAEDYYSTLLHELTHWTGHSSRTKRLKDLTEDFKGFREAYAFEELVAEIGSAIHCGLHQISKAPRLDHAAYLNSWIKELEEDPQLIFRAAARAQQAVDFCDKLQPEEE